MSRSVTRLPVALNTALAIVAGTSCAFRGGADPRSPALPQSGGDATLRVAVTQIRD